MPLPLIQVDAFTSKPFAGNPAAVCVLPEPHDEAWMQDVAREMNLSETAFLTRRSDGYALRWFTPAVEVDLCGHATLASAHVLWSEGHLEASRQARFHTRSGLLTADRVDDWIELDFPVKAEQPADPPPGLLDALNVNALYVGRNAFDFIVEVTSEHIVRALEPDFVRLKKVGARGIIVTSRSENGEFDFVSRFFAPGSGIDEDPVTGSAHCCLAPFWSTRLGRTEFRAFQASPRGGVLRVRLDGDRVKLAGQAVTVMRAQLLC
ncbi:MAG: PhzF family phenazine biosynthesis protein [Acidobacteria bacterium]|nr:PhzF family phenazine biosynthesis protein [Acidobacteriota bacterium]